MALIKDAYESDRMYGLDTIDEDRSDIRVAFEELDENLERHGETVLIGVNEVSAGILRVGVAFDRTLPRETDRNVILTSLDGLMRAKGYHQTRGSYSSTGGVVFYENPDHQPKAVGTAA